MTQVGDCLSRVKYPPGESHLCTKIKERGIKYRRTKNHTLNWVESRGKSAHCPHFSYQPISNSRSIMFREKIVDQTPYRIAVYIPPSHTPFIFSITLEMCPIFTYEYWNKTNEGETPSPSLTFSFLTEFFFQTLKSCFFQHFQLSKRQTQRVEEESSCSTIKPWYNEPRYNEFRDIVN